MKGANESFEGRESSAKDETVSLKREPVELEHHAEQVKRDPVQPENQSE